MKTVKWPSEKLFIMVFTHLSFNFFHKLLWLVCRWGTRVRSTIPWFEVRQVGKIQLMSCWISSFSAIFSEVGADALSLCPEGLETEQWEHRCMREGLNLKLHCFLLLPLWCLTELLQLSNIDTAAKCSHWSSHAVFEACALCHSTTGREGGTAGQREGENAGPCCLICCPVTAFFILNE